MRTAEHPYLAAGLALATAGTIAVAPVVPSLPKPAIPTVSIETQLTSGLGDLLNIPFNLLQAIFNIPFNEVNGITMFGNAMLWAGPWLSVGATNLWGEDPGDPGHFAGIIDMLFPFAKISGIYDPLPGYVVPTQNIDGTPLTFTPHALDGTPLTNFDWNAAAEGHMGLSQQITLMLDAQLPVSASSDATFSGPLWPVAPITGITFIDRLLWNLPGQKFPLTANWFGNGASAGSDIKTLSTDGFDFKHVIDPSAGPGPGGQVLTDPYFNFPGTIPAHPGALPLPALGSDGITPTGGLSPEGTLNPGWEMPWSDHSFKLDLAYPFAQFFQSLLNPLGSDTPGGPADLAAYLEGFHLPSIDAIAHMLQNLAAGLIVSFDPFVPGGILCPGSCSLGLDLLNGIVKFINFLWPRNDVLSHWIQMLNTPSTGPGGLTNPFGLTNGATGQGVNTTDVFAHQGPFDIGNPLPNDPPGSVETPLQFGISPFMQSLIDKFEPMRQWIIDTFHPKTIDFSNNDWWMNDGPYSVAAVDPAAAVDPSAAVDPGDLGEHVGWFAQAFDWLGLGAA